MMMNKKAVKVLNILLIVMALVGICTNVFAADEGFSPISVNPTEPPQTGTIKTVGGDIVGIIRTIGIVLSVVIIMVIGIMYLMGSPEQKSDYKKTFIPYIVGAALIFAGSLFAQTIFDFFSNMGKAQ